MTPITLEWPDLPEAFHRNLKLLADSLGVSPELCLTILSFGDGPGDESSLTLPSAIEAITKLTDEELVFILLNNAIYGSCFPCCHHWWQVQEAHGDILALTNPDQSDLDAWSALLQAARDLDANACRAHGNVVWKSLLKAKWCVDTMLEDETSVEKLGRLGCFQLEQRLAHGPSKGFWRHQAPANLDAWVPTVIGGDTLSVRGIQERILDTLGYTPDEEEIVASLHAYCDEIRYPGVKNPSYKVKDDVQLPV